jgi:Zn-dependent peptidase ImmA (M78 family)
VSAEGVLASGGVSPPFITINSNPNGLFMQPLPNPYMTGTLSVQQQQTLTVLHELGHLAADNGDSSVVVEDQGNANQSMMNSVNVAAACLD